MKSFFKLSICILCLFSLTVEARLTEKQKSDCEKLLQIAEFKESDWIYDECGFKDADVVWYDWAPILSQKKYAKGLYQICQRYPEHEYADLYCKKAADAGSIEALYTLAQNAKEAGEDELYEKDLLEIIARNPIQDKIKLVSVDDVTSRKAYEDLAKYYYELQDEVKTKNVIPFLQIAAEKGSPTAASTLAIFLYQKTDPDEKQMYEKYLWNAIINGCPAAEEVLGLINYRLEQRIDINNQNRLMNRLLFTCESSKTNNMQQQNIKKAENCSCNEVLSWVKSQEEKPFIILSLGRDSALLQDKDGMQYTVEAGEKVEGGYVVEEIRPTAVILRKTAQRTILLYREDVDCVGLCRNSNPQKIKGDIPPYKLTFTPAECEKIAEGIETLDNPLEPFRGVTECQLQDWKKWGEKALNGQKDKHLFLMANYEKSHYIPAYIARAELMFAQGAEQAYPKIKQTLQEALLKAPNDSLSSNQHEYAFCLQTALYLNGATKEEKQTGFNLAEQGAQKGYPQSMNMLGVAYAKGLGTKRNKAKAEELFLSAETASNIPFIDARRNYILLQTNKNLDDMRYGNCEQIIKDVNISKEELLELYK